MWATVSLSLFLKRCMDLIVAVPLIVALAPITAIISACICLTMGTPVIFRQARLGYKGKVFEILKFRTMTDTRGRDGEMLPDELRLTRLGKFLRRTSLDELPSLVNVLRGDVSLVGPRPLLSQYEPLYSTRQSRRHDMPPGLAGPVVARGRNMLSWKEKFELDVWFVDNWSLRLDFRILAATLWKMILGKGVETPSGATMRPYRGGTEPDEAIRDD
jgi:lipopolysaccharide/colanic/teichoic acid biosynthesis glycosyltransferase